MRGVAVGSEQRALIWALHEEGKSYAAIKEVVKLSKSTVQHVIKATKKERAALNKAKPLLKGRSRGRPPTVSKTFVLHFMCKLYLIWGLFRWKRHAISLAKRNPFWGAQRISDEVHKTMLDTYASFPPGHVFQVCL